jgi:hypothetical protein
MKMPKPYYNEDDGSVMMEEYDLHDFVIGVTSVETSNAGNVVAHSIIVDWRDYQPTDEELEKLEKAFEDFFQAASNLDSVVHDIAEYTC